MASGIYSDLGARYVSDIDVLVAKSDRILLQQTAKDNGYTDRTFPRNRPPERQGR